MYMYFVITENGQFFLKAHSGGKEKEYKFFLDPEKKMYHLKENYSDTGIPITIENEILTEETKEHIMIYELTNELD